MSDWGDDELEGVEAQPIDVDEPDGPTFGVDVRSLAGHLVDAAVQLHGGMGYMRGTRSERIYREVKVNMIGGGAEEIMKELAARFM